MIGGGGFASIWRAKTVGPGGFERFVAIKVMRPARAAQRRFQAMLLDEARLVARIQHPNVAQIWEVGEDPRSLYFVMELVDGESLDELRYRAEAAGKTLPLRALFRILADTCAGLHVAHELTQDGAPLGLVHRDVSPQNILVSKDGITKLIDFGIAKARERLAGDTTTGYIKGKISFMAPEQARSEDLDRRADVWAIGAVAYEIIEGKPPFDGATDIGRLAALVGPAPAPPMSADVPAALRAVVERTLDKDPDKRYPTALALKEAIEEALIESELETSATDVAKLLRPFFTPSSTVETEVTAKGEEATAERAVSSTIEAAARYEGTIEVPLHRRRLWPIVAVLPLVVPLAWWALTSSPSHVEGSATAAAASSSAPIPTSREVMLSAASPDVTIVTAAAVKSEDAGAAMTQSAPPVMAPSVQSSAPAPRRAPPRPRATTRAPSVDDNAIE